MYIEWYNLDCETLIAIQFVGNDRLRAEVVEEAEWICRTELDNNRYLVISS